MFVVLVDIVRDIVEVAVAESDRVDVSHSPALFRAWGRCVGVAIHSREREMELGVWGGDVG